MLAAMATRGALAPANIKQFSSCGDDLQVSDVLTELQKAGGEVSGGNLGRVEKLLVNQVITLDTLFHNLLQRAGSQENMKNLETFMRLALKAQAQARATAEALGILKNPPVGSMGRCNSLA